MKLKYSEYKELVLSLSEKKSDSVAISSGKDKLMLPIIEIVKNSKNKLRIYIGDICKDMLDDPELVVAITEFVENGGEVNVLVNNFSMDEARENNICKRLSFFSIQNKPIVVKSTASTLSRSYIGEKSGKTSSVDVRSIVIGDNCSYCIETLSTQKKDTLRFEYSFNNGERTKTLYPTFDELFEEGNVIDIDEVLKY